MNYKYLILMLILFSINVNGLPVINYTLPVVQNISVNENTNISFDVDVSNPDDTEHFYSWILDGISQAVTKAWNYIIGYTDASSSEPLNQHNVTVYVNDSNGNTVSYEWNVEVNNVELPPQILDFYQSPTNVSWDSQTIVAYCDIEDEEYNDINLTVDIQYRLPETTEWLNLTEYYDSPYWKANLTTQVNTTNSGTFDFRCRATDLTSQVSAYHTDYDLVNVYETNQSPSIPTTIIPMSGYYDTNIPVQCKGSYDLNLDDLYYTIEAKFINQYNVSTNWTTLLYESVVNTYDWYVLNLPAQTGIQFRCKSSDLILESDYYYYNSTLEISHEPSISLFDSGAFIDKYVDEHLIFNVFCNINGMDNTKIVETYADCNEDGKWDYVFDYSDTEDNYNVSITQTNDFFTCVYSEPGEKNIMIGCVTSKRGENLTWDRDMCKNINTDSTYCDFSKNYKVDLYER